MDRNQGEQLLELIASSGENVLIVSPFMKADAVERVLAGVSGYRRLTCVTRWDPIEIARGVSDLGVFDLLNSAGHKLLLLPQLHAKYYRCGEYCLVGSANLTFKGLGWAGPASNLEILVRVHVASPELDGFEEAIFENAVPVDEGLRREMQQIVDKLNREYQLPPPVTPKTLEGCNEHWLPNLRNPDNLYTAYSGNWDDIQSCLQVDAEKDLAILDVAPGLGELPFRLVVASRLLQFRLIREIDELVKTPQRFGAVRDFLKVRESRRDPSETWQATMRWLLYFLPERYSMRTANYSEIFARRTDKCAEGAKVE